ncbi:UDP-glycosyltransferase 74F2-like [Hibiscus syriacus]|uniref:UDP-glycosyltransferase 74F2-like n=1 Tax=Hibiscus syriacus TaxID=106335 RepID=UPI0019230A05|nr:UDP-glycosyltransferase 74F2-like [Hibiscus syriacus]
MELESGCGRVHVLAIPYPSQGHINPMHQFSKRLSSKGLKATFVTTIFISQIMKPELTGSDIDFDRIPDGCDECGFSEAKSVDNYLVRLQDAGSRMLTELTFCIIGAAFFMHACGVDYIYYYAHCGLLSLPVPSSAVPITIPSLPFLELRDMPSFTYVVGSYSSYFEMVLIQFSNVVQADFILVNTFYKLEQDGLKQTRFDFLWVIRSSEMAKVPDWFAKEMGDKSLIANWIPQTKVLPHEVAGYLFTHCGWNSTIEALCLGVSMVSMPQWTDQTTDAKLVEDVWKIGV